jgi:hypothetical protein
MGTNYPGAIDSFTNPTSGEPMNSPSHATQHANANAAIEAIETYVGISGSASLNAWNYGVLPDSTYTGGADSAFTARTTAWRALFTESALLGIPIFVPAGTYSSNYFYQNQAPQIYCQPFTVNILMQNQPYGQNYGWNFGPTSHGTTTTLTANAAKFADVLSLTSLPTGIAVGSIIMVGDTSLLVGGNSDVNTVMANNLYRVIGITGSGPYSVTIAGGVPINSNSWTPDPQGLVYPITSATGVVTALPGMLSGGFVRGLNFIAQGGATNVAYCLYFWQMRDLDVDVSYTGFGGPGILLSDCYKGRVRASGNLSLNIDETGVAGQYGYGIDVSGATCHFEIDMNCDQARHAVTVGGTGHNIRITGVATNTLSTAWDAHAGFTDVLFTGVTAVGCANGAALRGDRYRLVGSNFDNCGGGVEVFDRPIDVVIQGNTIRGCGNAIEIGTTGSSTPGVGLTIANNDIKDTLNAGITFATTSPFTDVLVVGNNFSNSGLTTPSPHVDIQSVLTRAYFERNTWRDNQGSPTTTGCISVDITGSTDLIFDRTGIHNGLAPVIGTYAAAVGWPLVIAQPATALTMVANAVTVPVTVNNVLITNNSSATATITLAVTGAVDGQKLVLRFLDFAGVAETLTHVNTENSATSVAATSNGSTTLPVTESFIFNGATSKWRCVAVA